MGSSGGGSSRPPNYPTPQGLQVPYGQSAPAQPNYTSFLPNDPGAMATGLTPEMIASINAPPPVQQMASAAPPPQGYGMNPRDQRLLEAIFGRDQLAQAMQGRR